MKILSASIEHPSKTFFHAGYISAGPPLENSVNYVLLLFMLLSGVYLFKQIKQKKKLTPKNIVIYIILIIIILIGLYEIYNSLTAPPEFNPLGFL